jgi:hypothetical protein
LAAGIGVHRELLNIGNILSARGLDDVEAGQNLRSEDNERKSRTDVNGVVINLRVGGSALNWMIWLTSS